MRNVSIQTMQGNRKMTDHLNTTFTPFWASTPQARKRTGRQRSEQHRQQKRERFYDPDLYVKITLTHAQSRFMPVRRQLSTIKKKLPYKLRKSELQQLRIFLMRTPNLHHIVLPKRRVNNRSINFSDSHVKWVDPLKTA